MKKWLLILAILFVGHGYLSAQVQKSIIIKNRWDRTVYRIRDSAHVEFKTTSDSTGTQWHHGILSILDSVTIFVSGNPINLNAISEVAVFSRTKDIGAAALGAVGAVHTAFTMFFILEIRDANSLGAFAFAAAASLTASIAIPSFYGAVRLINGNPHKVAKKDQVIVEIVDLSKNPWGWGWKYRVNR